MWLATSCAILLQLPITICHFFYLESSQIAEMYPSGWERFGDKFYIYMQRLKLCYRFYYPGGSWLKQIVRKLTPSQSYYHTFELPIYISLPPPDTFDYAMITYFTFAANILAVVLILLSVALISFTVVRIQKMPRVGGN